MILSILLVIHNFCVLLAVDFDDSDTLLDAVLTIGSTIMLVGLLKWGGFY